MRRKTSSKSFVLEVRGIAITITETLYSRLIKLAASASMSIEEYVEKIEVPKEYKYPDDSISTLLAIYDFCLKDCVQVEKTKEKLRKQE